ncbi:transcription factor TFIIF complex subunit Tfg3 [Massospora cicadina]|nr:transcription factor TFIIF complex subunit Tfg3 [Massospora cicadina]
MLASTMKTKIIDKKIIVRTSSEQLNYKCSKTGNLMYRWKVAIFALDDDGVPQSDLPFISHVEFLLHETFDKPRRFVQSSPFQIIEQGWGSFDLIIYLHFTDSAHKPFKITHDLNFNSPRYNVTTTATFRDVSPRFLQLLRGKTPPEDNDSSTSRHSRGSKTIRTSSKKPQAQSPAPTKFRISPLSQPEKRKRPRPDVPEKAQTSSKSISSGDSLSSFSPPQTLSQDPLINPRKKTRPDIPRWVSHEVLAEKLGQLEGEDILKVIELIKELRSDKTYINEEVKGSFTFDVYTLENDLLRKLWVFVNRRLGFGH